MTALATALSRPNAKKISVAEITCGKIQKAWDKSWSPYTRKDLSFCFWASDIRGIEDGSEVNEIEETIKSRRFFRSNYYSEFVTSYNRADSTANNRPTLSVAYQETVKAFSYDTLQEITKTDYMKADQFTWFFVANVGSVSFTPFAFPFSVTTIGPFAAITDSRAKLSSKHGGSYLEDWTGSDAWHVFRVDRDGNSYRFYCDGVLIGSDTVTGNLDVTGTFFGNLFNIHSPGSAGTVKVGGIFLFKDKLSDSASETYETGMMKYYGVGSTAGNEIYSTEETDRVVSVIIDGVSLTESDTIEDCLGTLETWLWDGSTVYINSATDPRGYDTTTLLMLRYDYATEEKTLDGKYYGGRLIDAPDLSVRIEEAFSDPTQVGGGSISLTNGDRFFNRRMENRWDAGRTVIKLGCDYADYVMPYSEYQTIGTWNNDSWDLSDSFDLTLKEIKERIKKEIPIEYFTRDAYPQINESDDSKVKPIIYGKVYGCAPICVDIEAKKFICAGHRIKSIGQVRADNSSYWEGVTVTDTNISDASFVFSDWDGSQELSVDIEGKTDENGFLIDNPSDIIKDLLATIGETDIDVTSFATSKTALDRGQYLPSGQRITTSPVSVYLAEETDVFDVISEINQAVGSYLYSDANGKYHYDVFEIDRGEGLSVFKEEQITDFETETETTERISYAKVSYARRNVEGWAPQTQIERKKNQYARNGKGRTSSEVEVKLPTFEDAVTFANKLFIYNGELNHVYSFKLLPATALLLTPGQQIHIQYEYDEETGRYTHDFICEIYEMKFDVVKFDGVEIVAGNRHGYGDKPGFWCEDNVTIPARYSGLAGYGDGSANVWKKSWHPQIKSWCRQNMGYWTDDNGFADSTDPESYMCSIYV
jgi:hypothetical protein